MGKKNLSRPKDLISDHNMIKIGMEDRNKLIRQLLHRITTQELKKLLAMRQQCSDQYQHKKLTNKSDQRQHPEPNVSVQYHYLAQLV